MLIGVDCKTKFAALLIPLLLLMLAPASFGQQTENDSPQMDQVFVHLDLSKLGQSQTGKVIVDSLYQIPFVNKQLNSIPENLQFLTNAKFESITLQVNGNQQQQTAVMEIACELNEQKLFDLLSHANGYAKVQFGGIDIHHWVTDFETLGNQFVGEGEGPWADNKSDSIYLAMPAPNRFWVSTSLSKLTEILADSNRSLAKKTAVFDKFGQGQNLISLHVAVAGDEVPGELLAVVREEESGELRVHASLKSRNEAEKQVATMIASLIRDPKAAMQMFAVAPNANSDHDEKEPVKSRSETNSDKLKHATKQTIGFQLNSATLEQSDMGGMIDRFLKDCVKCEHQKDTLTLDVNLFLGPSRVLNIAWDSKEGIAIGLKYNVMQFYFNVYTTDAERQAAQRIAEGPAAKLKRAR